MGESAVTIEYSKNGGEWTSITATPLDPQEMTGGTKIDVVSGDTVQFRGNNDTYYDINNDAVLGAFAFSTCGFELEGNIMSLIDSTNFSSITAMTTDNDGAFELMFVECTGLASAENLVLPAITLTEFCYRNMFAGCTSLTEAPALPAATLANNCYEGMFAECTSLTTAPALSATTLAEACYAGMFENCESLNYIKCLATDISASYCTGGWVYGVAPTGTFAKNPEMSSWTTGYDGIPEGWTVIDRDILKLSKTYSLVAEEGGTVSLTVTSPTSNWTATTNSDWIVISQVTGGTGDTTITITVPQTDTPRGSKIIFSDETDSVTLDVVEATPLTFDIISGGTISWQDLLGCQVFYSSDNGITWNNFTEVSVNNGDKLMFVADNDRYLDIRSSSSHFTCSENTFFNVYGNIMSLLDSKYFYTATTLTETGALGSLFCDCQGIISAENLVLPATTLADYCYANMFSGCRSLTTAPELPATTLEGCCYQEMFMHCSSLTTAPELPATVLPSRCYYEMFYHCTSLNYIKCLATDISANGCTGSWVAGVASTGTFVKNPNMSSWTRDSYGIPDGWTIQDATS